MSAEALASDPAFAVAGRRWTARLAAWPETKKKYDDALAAWTAEEAAAKALGAGFSKAKPGAPTPLYPQHQPAVLHNAMIHPLLPAALRGVIWYQGEANAGRPDEYRRLFPALISDWRQRFGQPALPFYWVQLANYGNGGRPDGTEWPALREAQESALVLPATGRALAIDVGHATSIHPRNKQAVGRRLAWIALKRTYGKKEVVDSGPAFSKVELNAGDPGRVRVFFDLCHGGLVNRAAGGLRGFEVAGADKRFIPAEAAIEDAAAGTVLVHAPVSVGAPAYVRYAWRNDPPNSLANGAGLPAAPFRTDR
jgi:sialate O-acetylesterase